MILDPHADIPNRESGQYGGNEVPWPRTSALLFIMCSSIKKNCLMQSQFHNVVVVYIAFPTQVIMQSIYSS